MKMRIRWYWFLPLILICLFIVLVGPARLLSTTFSNIGWTAVMKTNVMETSVVQSQTASTAMNWFEAALRVNPHNRSAQRGLGFTLLQQGDEAAAVKSWQQTSNMGRELYYMGQQAQRVQRAQPSASDEAVNRSLKWYNLATQVDPSLRDPWFQLGQLYEQRGEWQAAEYAYRDGLKSTHGVRIESSDLLFWLARIVEKHHVPSDLMGAMALYDQALAEDAYGDPWVHAQTYYRRAEIFRGRGELEEAVEAYKTLIALNPKNYWGLFQLATLLQTLDRDLGYAEDLLWQAIDVDANHFAAYRQLGLLYQQMDQITDAKSMYEEALIRNPDDVVSREKLELIQQ